LHFSFFCGLAAGAILHKVLIGKSFFALPISVHYVNIALAALMARGTNYKTVEGLTFWKGRGL